MTELGRTGPSVPEDERFAMPPKPIIERCPCDPCFRLYCYLDLIQGARGRPAAGYGNVGDALGWSRQHVTIHAQHLATAGLIVVRGRGSQQRELVVVHNPSRKRRNSAVDLPERKKPKKAEPRWTKDGPAASERPGVGHDDHPDDLMHRSDAWPYASERPGVGASERPGRSRSASEGVVGLAVDLDLAVERLLDAFPGSTLVDERAPRCAWETCQLEADGGHGPKGERYCRDHEPF